MEDLETKLKNAEVDEKLAKIKIEEANLLVEKITLLRQILEASVPKYTEFGESKYVAVLEETEAELIKSKMFKLISKL